MILGATVWILLLPLLLVLFRDRPEDVGQKPDGFPWDPRSVPARRKDLGPEPVKAVAAGEIGVEVAFDLAAAMRTRTYWIMAGATAAWSMIFTGITLPEFVRWYFWEQPSRILRVYFAYLRAFVEIFSFIFLVRTLISPWRQITDPYPARGFNLSQFSQTLTLNIVSRTIGLIFRSVTLFFGLAAVVALTICFGFFYMAWLSFPVVFWVGLTYIFSAAF